MGGWERMEGFVFNETDIKPTGNRQESDGVLAGEGEERFALALMELRSMLVSTRACEGGTPTPREDMGGSPMLQATALFACQRTTLFRSSPVHRLSKGDGNSLGMRSVGVKEIIFVFLRDVPC